MDFLQIITTALVMGLIGSLHCVGMCGPLAMALPVAHRSSRGRLLGGLIYNTGRVLTYAVLGGILGLAGEYLLSSHWQGNLSIALGACIFMYLLFPSQKKATTLLATWANKPFVHLRLALGRLFQSKKYTSLFAIGVLNGLLPCGMIYLAVSSSLLAGSALKGSLFMLLFGLGTFPAMVAVVFFGSYVNQQLRLGLRKAVPVFLFFMATLLVLRGLNLGIPFVSPALPDAPQAAVLCH
ncbi:sulfite exporter TauE/SafE family protein [Paraflavisolibacter sp. H34]|uniref:sulfite exporter TauE/SafE family protein n=1 Tax=Huijunlia imazamoxiresistens TaxID=3127457 RepID=UPI00301B16F3